MEQINRKDAVDKLWPELMWIADALLREKVRSTWALALEKSALKPDDLYEIPFTLLAGKDLKVSFMNHKRAVVHIARDAGLHFHRFFGDEMPVDLDILIAGAILADVGKLLEYEVDTFGRCTQGTYGEYIRHPFSGVSLAEQCGVPAPVCHIIAAHAAEGDMVKRSAEAYIVHHADFMAFLPFKNRKP